MQIILKNCSHFWLFYLKLSTDTEFVVDPLEDKRISGAFVIAQVLLYTF